MLLNHNILTVSNSLIAFQVLTTVSTLTFAFSFDQVVGLSLSSEFKSDLNTDREPEHEPGIDLDFGRDLNAEGLNLLAQNSEIISSTKFHFYRQKMELFLKFLSQDISRLQFIQRNASDLLTLALPLPLPWSADRLRNTSSKYSNMTFDSFKVHADEIEIKMVEAEQRMRSHRQSIQRCSWAMKNSEPGLLTLLDTFAGVLVPVTTGTAKSTSAQVPISERHATEPETPPSPSPLTISTTVASKMEDQTESSLVATTPVPDLNPDWSTGCGGRLLAQKGSINYQHDQVQTSNSFQTCIWIISAKYNNNKLRVTLQNSQFHTQYESYLSVGYFNNSQYDQPDTFIWKKFNVSKSGPETIDIPSTVAFIQFVSARSQEETNRSGNASAMTPSVFYLHYEAYVCRSVDMNYWSGFLKGPSGSFKYPRNQSMYGAFERTAIVIQPTELNSTLYIKWFDIEEEERYTSNAQDSLNIWSFEPDLIWRRREQLLGKENQSGRNLAAYARKYDFNSNSTTGSGLSLCPMILAFQSDHNYEYTGFEYYWN